MEEDSRTLEVGKTYYLDNKEFKIKKYLSYGAFKHVYIAEDKHDKRNVVIAENKNLGKILKEIKIFKRLKRELTKDGKLICNPKIICPIDVIENGKYIITNYFEGSDLFDFIDTYIKEKKFIPLSAVKQIMINCIDALIDLHDKYHFIHLDIKPENIMINPTTFEIGIIDLGEGCFDDELESCNLHPFKSTIGYISPELMFESSFIENDKDILKSSDVYSLGCVFYELLYCRKPLNWIEDTYDIDNSSEFNNFISILRFVLRSISFEEAYNVNKIRDPTKLKIYGNIYDIETKTRSIEVYDEDEYFENEYLFDKLDEIINQMLNEDPEERIKLKEALRQLTTKISEKKESKSIKKSTGVFDLSEISEELEQVGGSPIESIYELIEKKDIGRLNNLINREPTSLYYFYKVAGYNFLPIEWAVKKNCIECIDIMLSGYERFKDNTIIHFNSDVRLLGQPIHFAVENGNLEMIEFLIDKGFNPNKLNKMGYTPLHLAVLKNKLNIVNYLLRTGKVEFKKLDKDGNSVLKLALEKHHFDIAKRLIVNGMKIASEKNLKMDEQISDFLNFAKIKEKRHDKKKEEREEKIQSIMIYDNLCNNLMESLSKEILQNVKNELKTDLSNIKTREDFCRNLLRSIVYENIFSENF